MTVKKIWQDRWKDKSKSLEKSTSLDFFAKGAYVVLVRYITENDKKVLEVGSGTGRFCIALGKRYPKSNILGIDYTDESVKLSRKGAELKGLKNVKFEKADLFKLPYKDNSFDVVFENGVIEHFTNYQDAVDEMIRVTKKGGKVIVNTNNFYCFAKTLEKAILGKHYPFGYEKSFKHAEIRGCFRKAGLTRIKVFGYNAANYIVRSFFFCKTLKSIIGILMTALEKIINFLTLGYFTKIFGYMLFGIGKK